MDQIARAEKRLNVVVRLVIIAGIAAVLVPVFPMMAISSNTSNYWLNSQVAEYFLILGIAVQALLYWFGLGVTVALGITLRAYNKAHLAAGHQIPARSGKLKGFFIAGIVVSVIAALPALFATIFGLINVVGMFAAPGIIQSR